MTIDKIQIFDGAQGTVLADAHPKEPGKEGKSKHNGVAVLNLTNPARVQQMHRDYLEAGAQYITCNSFELNPVKWQSQEYTWQEIADAINNEARRGCTVLDGIGWYTKKPVKVILVMCRKLESVNISRIIKAVDPKAFITKTNVNGVYGDGFDEMKVRLKVKKEKVDHKNEENAS